MIKFMIGDRLAERDMTQADLSRLSGIRAATISDLCRNRCCNINLDSIEIICKVLDCDLCDIMTMHYEELKRAEAAARHAIWIARKRKSSSHALQSPEPTQR